MANDEDPEKPTYQRSLSSGSNKPSTVLPWDRFSNWLHCACVVTFDLELGQAMEVVYPSHVRLTDKEKMNICYLSFPDSNSGCMGDTQFHFRIRQSAGKHAPNGNHVKYDEDCPTALQSDSAHFYGFVYFRQTKDKSIRRGYFQKSVVLISRLPFYNLFHKVNEFIAPEFFDNGEPSLEAACHDIDQWSEPCPGETLNLPIMGSVVQTRIPSRADKLIGPNVPLKADTFPGLRIHTILPTLHEVDSFSAFQPVLPHLQMLWEIVLTAEPLVVMATLPTVCANTVQALVGMIWPLKYCTDYRPFFTIHDSEFKEYTTRTQAPPSVILGVTNPFFAKTLQHWPHILRIGDSTTEESPRGLGLSNKIKKSSSFSSLKTLDSKPGVYTRYKSFLNKDKVILKRLLKGVQTKRPVEVQNAMLRRFYLELTQSFMIPLERYVASLMPLQRNVSPHKGPPELKPFLQEEFIQTLDHSGPQLTSGIKGDWVGLYRKFFKSANFEGWYHCRRREVNQKLQVIHLEALCNADLVNWIRDKQEVEIVDLILRLREKLVFAKNNQVPVNKDLLDKLTCHLNSVICSLPDDLQTVLRKT